MDVTDEFDSEEYYMFLHNSDLIDLYSEIKEIIENIYNYQFLNNSSSSKFVDHVFNTNTSYNEDILKDFKQHFHVELYLTYKLLCQSKITKHISENAWLLFCYQNTY
jgi:hypothetical protein